LHQNLECYREKDEIFPAQVVSMNSSNLLFFINYWSFYLSVIQWKRSFSYSWSWYIRFFSQSS